MVLTLLASAATGLTFSAVGPAPTNVRSASPAMLFGLFKKEASAPAQVILADGTIAVSEEEVLECQKNWAAAIAGCSKIHADGGDYIGAAAGAAADLYGYGHHEVLFKPTKATDFPFRPTAEEAMSYFVGGDVVEGGYDEDSGFAINGGKGWANVDFFNHQISLNGKTATAMGYYIFTDASTLDQIRVEYTFGYKRCDDGKARIFLHHSSVPYLAAGGGGKNVLLAPLTEEDVRECQQKWARAIASISDSFLDEGDFIGEAAEAAGELYGYGFGDVLFKPTKAADVPFRPTAGEAMSYFVGGGNVDNGYDEDAGFAINGGSGWESVVFNNHNIELLGTTAMAMGSYVFTDATTKNKVNVEYTFGYKRCSDGKPRIFLHHSSVPYSGGGGDQREEWLERAKQFKKSGKATPTGLKL
jgi:hypothetical protein